MSDKDNNKMIIIGLAETGKSTIVKSFMEEKKDFFDDVYSATINYERKNFTFLGTDLSIFDLGGQPSFIDKFTGELAKFIFSDVLAFVFVIDVAKFEELSRAKYYLDLSIDNVLKYSPNAIGYIFLHKVDLLKKEHIKEIEAQFKEFLLDGIKLEMKLFMTSVYQDSIYTALGDLFSNLTSINKTIDPVIKEFVSTYSNLIEFGGIITRSGTPLSSNSLFPNASSYPFSSLMLLTDEYLRNIAKFDKQNPLLINIEFKEKILIIKNMRFDISLIVCFNKNREINLSQLIQKVQIFTSTLESSIDDNLKHK